IVKNKLFFFLSYEGLRLTNPQPGTSWTFTRDARVLAEQAANTMAPAYSGYMAPILNAYPLPSHDPSVGDGSTCTSISTCIAPFTRGFQNVSRLDSGSARVDYALNSRRTLFARYVQSPSSTVADGSLTSISNTGITLSSQSGTVGLTEVFGPTVVNDLRANYTHTGLRESFTDPSFTGTLASLFPAGFSQPPLAYSPNDMLLSFSFLGLGVPELDIGPNAANNRQGEFDIVDTLSLVKGSHMLKFGTDFRVNDPTVDNAPYDFSAWFYSAVANPICGTPGPGGPGPGPVPGGPGLGPDEPLPQFICGKAGSTTVMQNTGQGFRFFNWSLFAQDSWKVTPRLTVTYGLRYEIDPAPHSLNGKPFFSLTNFDPVQCTTTPEFVQGTTICNVGIAPLGTAPYPTRWRNLAPRIGVAYQTSRNPNWGTVLRAGFGLFYDTGNDASSGTLGPFSPETGYTPAEAGVIPNLPCPASGTTPAGGFSTGSQYLQFPITNLGCVTPPAIQTNISPSNPYIAAAQAVAPNLKLPVTYEFNAAMQQEFGRAQSLTLSYVGAIGQKLIGAIPLFGKARLGDPIVTVPLSPTFPTSMVVYGNYASSQYNALQVYFHRQFYHGLGANASYTWAHSLDDASNFNAGAVFPFSVNYSNSDFDIRQTFAASVVYDVPTPFKGNHLARALLGHWSFDPIYHYQTAPPINAVAVLGPSPVSGFTDTQRPNIIPGVPIYVYGAQCAAEYGSCPGGFAINNAAMGSPLGATAAEAAAAGCGQNPTTGAFCRTGTGITPGASSGAGQGDLGRNTLRGFPLRELDLDVHRDFLAGDRLRVRFEADIFNLLNQANFASPSAVLTDSSFGTSRSMMNASFGSGNASTGGGYNSLYTMGGPRAIQLAIKVFF
ncbi:MAG: TonB-dependent receptor, partial [Acidobacteriia bacterium]|nr:TonB-dependent receptor [Terriglobia bacterium]